MCSGHDDPAGREELARLSRRGFLRAAAATAAVVGTSSALAAPALAQEGSGGAAGHSRHRVPRDQISIQLYTLRDQLTIDWREPWPRWPRSATPGSSTPASSAAP